MSLTPAGRYVVACLILTVLLAAVGVVGRVVMCMWDAEKVFAVGTAVVLVPLFGVMAWRWRE